MDIDIKMDGIYATPLSDIRPGQAFFMGGFAGRHLFLMTHRPNLAVRLKDGELVSVPEDDNVFRVDYTLTKIVLKQNYKRQNEDEQEWYR